MSHLKNQLKAYSFARETFFWFLMSSCFTSLASPNRNLDNVGRKNNSPVQEPPVNSRPPPTPYRYPYPPPPPPPRNFVPADGPIIRGTSNFYGQAGTAFYADGYTTAPAVAPGKQEGLKEEAGPQGDASYSLRFHGLFGYGPLRIDNFFMNAHYKYSQDWGSKQSQVFTFWDEWLSGGRRTAENFIFRTDSLLRTHEFVVDARYVEDDFLAGLFSRLTYSRIGSSLLGTENETAETLVLTENFVPYFAFKYDRYYRGQISLPFRTELNREDEGLNNKSYLLSPKGRGYPTVSLLVNNAFILPSLRSIIHLDLFRYEYIYQAIQNDRTKMGVSAAWDLPLVKNLRIAPKFLIAHESYFVPRTRMTESSPGVYTPAEKARVDFFWSGGLSVYYDFNRQNRVSFDIGIADNKSNIPEFNSQRLPIILVQYAYSWPTTAQVNKRAFRFSETTFAEEF